MTLPVFLLCNKTADRQSYFTGTFKPDNEADRVVFMPIARSNG